MRFVWMGVVAALLVAGCGPPTEDGGDVRLGGLEVSPAALDFGQVQFESYSSGEVTLHNPGERPWAVEVTLDSEDFDARVGTFDLDPGETVVIPVSLDGSWERRVHTGTLVIALRESGERLEIPLTGESVEPRVEVEPATLDFGTVAVGQRKTLTITVSNRGVDTVRFGETKTYDLETYAVSTAFRLVYPERSWDGAWSLPAGDSMTLQAIFEPGAAGAFAAEHRLDVRPLDWDPPRVRLTGRGGQ